MVRKERQKIDHVGVCAYIQEENCKYKQLKDLNCCEDHESLWPYLRPSCFPRKVSCINAGVIYQPSKANGSLTHDHLFHSLALTEARYPNCCLLVTGDYNRLNIHVFLNYFRLKQIVKVPTGKKATLDLILNKCTSTIAPHKHAHRSGCLMAPVLWELLRKEGTILIAKRLPWGVTCEQATRQC